MTKTRLMAWIGLLVLTAGIGAGTAVAQKDPAKNPPAARVGDEVITLEELEQAVKPQLAKLEEQRYEILEQRLDQLIGERLLAQEAKRRNISVEDLLKTEVLAKAPDVPDSEVTGFINQNRGRLPKMDDKELRLKVWDHLRSQKVNEQRQSYLQGLRGRSQVTVLLQEPTSARYEVSGERGFARGPKDAPVTIVEFSDFQCPFCGRAAKDLRELVGASPEVTLVFRHFPLDTSCNANVQRPMHANACLAAYAAECAGKQGHFWEYHDILFENGERLGRDALVTYAQRIGLDTSAFERCLEDPATRARVAADVEAATRAGVNSTPTLFINGRLVEGALERAYYDYAVIIERHLPQGGSRNGAS